MNAYRAVKLKLDFSFLFLKTFMNCQSKIILTCIMEPYIETLFKSCIPLGFRKSIKQLFYNLTLMNFEKKCEFLAFFTLLVNFFDTIWDVTQQIQSWK